MASAFSHVIAATAIGSFFYRTAIPKRVWVLGAGCAVVPDLDVLGFGLGVRYGDFLGHRGFTHSLFFAAALTLGVVMAAFPRGVQSLARAPLWLYLFLVTASHGVLDGFTNGGLGVAFFSPFENGRYFFPFRPVEVSPIGIGAFFTARGVAILRSEVLWIWLPSLGLTACGLLWRVSRDE